MPMFSISVNDGRHFVFRCSTWGGRPFDECSSEFLVLAGKGVILGNGKNVALERPDGVIERPEKFPLPYPERYRERYINSKEAREIAPRSREELLKGVKLAAKDVRHWCDDGQSETGATDHSSRLASLSPRRPRCKVAPPNFLASEPEQPQKKIRRVTLRKQPGPDSVWAALQKLKRARRQLRRMGIRNLPPLVTRHQLAWHKKIDEERWRRRQPTISEEWEQ